MKILLVIPFLLASPTFAQDLSAVAAAESACGSRDTKFEVDTNQTRPAVPQPDDRRG